MKKILIYTIFRNSEKYIDLYYSQVKNIVYSFPEIEFYFSAYENDSSDGTKEALLKKDWSFFKDFSIITENIGTRSFGSVVSEERVRNIANARNKAILAKNFLYEVDYVMNIESDVKYDVQTVEKIINFNKKEDFDIVSGFTWHIENDEFRLYDKWATRTTDATGYYKKVEYGKVVEDLMPNWNNVDYAKYYSTSNGICLYKAKPLQDGIRYGHISSTINKADCEMYVICEDFIKNGYDKIFIIHNALIEHGENILFKNKIPKIIWQTYKTDYEDLPSYAKEATKTWKKLNPDYEYRYFNDRDIYKFIKYNYGDEMIKLFESFKVPVMKADLWRYLVTYKYGGIYCDIDTLCLDPIDKWINSESKMVVAPENGLHYVQWIFAVEPNSPIIKEVIDLLVDRCQNIDYDMPAFVHHYTGPGLFTDGIRKFFDLPDLNHDCESMKKHFNCYCELLQKEALGYASNKKLQDAGFFCYSGKHWRMFRDISVKHIFGSEQWNDGQYSQWTKNPLAKKSRQI